MQYTKWLINFKSIFFMILLFFSEAGEKYFSAFYILTDCKQKAHNIGIKKQVLLVEAIPFSGSHSY